MLLVPQDTHGEHGAGSGLKPDGAREAFVLLRVIVLQADLKLHRLQKLSALALVPVQDFLHRLVEGVARDFAAHSSPGCDNRKRANPIVFQLHFRYSKVKVTQSCAILCDSMD